MLIVARLVPLVAVVLAAAADAPSPDAPPGAPAPGTQAPSAQAPAAPVPMPMPVGDEDIRSIFAGKAACPPEPWPVSTGPWEFHDDGNYFRAQDLAAAHGRYAIQNGKICVTLMGSDKADFCLAVLKRGDTYLFRLDDSASAASRREPVAVTPCPLPHEPPR